MKLRTLIACALLAGAPASIRGVEAAGAGGAGARAAGTWTPPDQTYHSSIPAAGRKAFFGELHLHTAMSFDAWTFGTKVMPDEAYRFARGERVMVPAAQVRVEQGVDANGDVAARREWPLDFAAVTDHSEFLGAMHEIDDAGSRFSQTPVARVFVGGHGKGCIFWQCAVRRSGDPAGALQDLRVASDLSDGWDLEMHAANANYEPGAFTTFVAYEWTAAAGPGVTMHRNVIFNADHAPRPFTAVDSNKPEDLWKYLEAERREGVDVIAIPHNSNLSEGHDFDWNMSDGRPIDAAYAAARALNEPLAEIAQIKGTSDTTPDLSPEDEFADFDLMDRVAPGQAPNHHGSYIREAYGRGLVIQTKVGVNPFKMGVVGASDIHNGLSVSQEDAYASGISGLGGRDMWPTGAAARRALGMEGGPMRNGAGTGNPLKWRPGALTGVWAEENTRASIFAALKRKETFATSGSRIRVRMFGGWSFQPRIIRSADWVAKAYAEGVPMGGDLPAKPESARAPTFILQALKDPDGANLDRIQIIKVWLDHGGYKEKVFDAALSNGRRDSAGGRAPPVGDTVDLRTGAYVNTIGGAILTAVWRDPEFDPATPAVYYARVLEIPTPRWNTLVAIRNHLPLPSGAPAIEQQRAWTSPIWYAPAHP